MNILFHSNQLGIRGTETALYDYAHYNETILGNLSYIAAPIEASDMTTLPKFIDRFDDRVLLYNSMGDLKNKSHENKIDVAYYIKAGFNDGLLIPGVKSIVHAVFTGKDPHGDVYIAVSKWLGDKYNVDYLPHIVDIGSLNINESYREHLGYTKDDIVFGRYGGYDQFDVPYLPEVVESVANLGVKFLFMNTAPLHNHHHSNIVYLNAAYDLETKAAFINTCDAMLHGRTEGESFGLAIAEFLSMNKPVITNITCRDRNHIELLGSEGLYYSTPNELYSILVNYQKNNKDVKHLVSLFSPEKVMYKFNQFIT
jgi:glycosyltransferase involved in cell wall biosynthesis